jgi:hypothetical protein
MHGQGIVIFLFPHPSGHILPSALIHGPPFWTYYSCRFGASSVFFVLFAERYPLIKAWFGTIGSGFGLALYIPVSAGVGWVSNALLRFQCEYPSVRVCFAYNMG